jgi:hypothetical protein
LCSLEVGLFSTNKNNIVLLKNICFQQDGPAMRPPLLRQQQPGHPQHPQHAGMQYQGPPTMPGYQQRPPSSTAVSQQVKFYHGSHK